MYRFAVCDDNPADADYVTALIKEWNQKAGIPPGDRILSFRGSVPLRL